MNENIKDVIEILKTYAFINQIPMRSTQDLSPLELWLLFEIVRLKKELNK